MKGAGGDDGVVIAGGAGALRVTGHWPDDRRHGGGGEIEESEAMSRMVVDCRDPRVIDARDQLERLMNGIPIADKVFNELNKILIKLDDVCAQSPVSVPLSIAEMVETKEPLRGEALWRREIEAAKSDLSLDNPAYAAIQEVYMTLRPKEELMKIVEGRSREDLEELARIVDQALNPSEHGERYWPQEGRDD